MHIGKTSCELVSVIRLAAVAMWLLDKHLRMKWSFSTTSHPPAILATRTDERYVADLLQTLTCIQGSLLYL